MHRKTSRNDTPGFEQRWEIEDVVPEPLAPASPVAFPLPESGNIQRNSMISGVQDVEEESADDESEFGERCAMSLGWLCFIMGFVFIIPWALGMILPLCSANKNDKWAGYWNGLAAVAASITFTSVYLAYPE